MKKIMIFGFLCLCLLTLAGCVDSNITNQGSKDDSNIKNIISSDINSQTIEGGENSRIRGYYQFKNYEDFSFFYDQFKENNMERYLVPNDKNNEFIFEYAFLSEGIQKKDYESKQFNIRFPIQTMYLNIFADEIEIKGNCFNVNSLQSTTTICLKYELENCLNGIFVFTLLTKDNYAVYNAIVKNAFEISKLNEICEKIVTEFEKGVI